jgi:hypothetical protein
MKRIDLPTDYLSPCLRLFIESLFEDVADAGLNDMSAPFISESDLRLGRNLVPARNDLS